MVSWSKTIGNSLMFFKVDFKKAYEYLSWDYLLEIMHIIGFGPRWRGKIKKLLVSARASVLLNRSPTCEFQIHRGLRQGDPLSLFIYLWRGYTLPRSGTVLIMF